MVNRSCAKCKRKVNASKSKCDCGHVFKADPPKTPTKRKARDAEEEGEEAEEGEVEAMDEEEEEEEERDKRGTKKGKQQAAKPKGKWDARKKKKVVKKGTDEPDTEVVGEGEKQADGTRVFQAFRVGDTLFSLNDCVLMKNSDPDEEPFVGRVEKIYIERNDDEPKLTINWYYRASDTCLSPSERRAVPKDEIFASNSIDPNELSAVDGKCLILEWHLRKEKKASKGDDEIPIFYCRKYYDAKKRTFKTLNIEDGEDEDVREAAEAAYEEEEEDEEGDAKDIQVKKVVSPKKGVSTVVTAATAAKSPATSPKKPKGKKEKQVTLPRSEAVLEASGGDLETARQRLHVSAVPDTLPCREVEYYKISSFVKDMISARSSGCMFVSGVPGTGKTATIRIISKDLQAERDAGTLDHFQFIEINAMSLITPQQIYTELWTLLSEKDKETKVTSTHALELLNKRFKTPSPNRTCTVVLVDEVDQLWTRKQDVLYNLFDWPMSPHSRLILVAVANTMDLPERVLVHRVASRVGLTRLTFAPYTRDQLIAIVKSRLDGLAAFNSDAIDLCARKVATVSGDARRVLDICRRAAEIAGSSATSSSGSSSATVTIDDICKALDEMTSSALMSFLQMASTYERLFLISVVHLFRKTGLEETTFAAVVRVFDRLIKQRGRKEPSIATLSQICMHLGSTQALELEPGYHHKHQKIRLGCSVDDVIFAFREDPAVKMLQLEQQK